MFNLLHEHVRVDVYINLPLIHCLLQLQATFVEVQHAIRLLVERLSESFQLQFQNVVFHLMIGLVESFHYLY